MAEYLLVGAPTEAGASKSSTFKTLRDRVTPLLADAYELRVPDALKVGSQDALVATVEELQKLDTMAEQVTFRMEKEYRNLDPKFDLMVDGTTLQSYLSNFVWNDQRFSGQTYNAQALVKKFRTEVEDKDGAVKRLASEYNAAKQQLDGLLRKGSGTLQSRSLVELVSKEDCIPPSEYLVAVFVVVNSGDVKKFEQSYDTLTNFVVPDSAKKICTEGDFTMFRVVLFKNVLKEYKDKARDLKWMMREYEHSDTRRDQEKKELDAAKLAVETSSASLKKKLKVEFPDMFVVLSHMKALRLHCESILRFGLPQSSLFCTAVLAIKRGKFEDLRKMLDGLYKHLADDAFVASEEEMMANVEIFPYVSVSLNAHGPEFRDL